MLPPFLFAKVAAESKDAGCPVISRKERDRSRVRPRGPSKVTNFVVESRHFVSDFVTGGNLKGARNSKVNC